MTRISRRASQLGSAVAVAVVALAAQACSPDLLRPNAPAESAAEMRVPMRIAHGLPLVEARLPNDASAWFLIDTGAGDFTLVDQQLTSALKLKHDVVRDPLLPSIHLSAVVPFLEVDGHGRRNLTVYVTDALADRAELADLGVVVEGVLGAGFFKGQCLWFDWANREFTATRPRVRLARHVPIPLKVGLGGDLRAIVRVNGREAQALIDTGSATTLIAQEFADRVAVAYDRGAIALHRETSIGTAATRNGTLDRLSLGSEELLKIAVQVVERRLANADLVLGTDVLSRYGVILDLSDPAYLVLDPAEGGATPES